METKPETPEPEWVTRAEVIRKSGLTINAVGHVAHTLPRRQAAAGWEYNLVESLIALENRNQRVGRPPIRPNDYNEFSKPSTQSKND